MSREPDDLPAPDPRTIGYRRPPVAHQFRAGISGNPNGRPKGSPTVQELIQREARRTVKLRTADGIVTVPKLEALVRKLYAQALEGDLAAARLIVQYADAFGKTSADTAADDPIDPSQVDDEALKRMLARFDGFLSKDQ